MAYQVTVVGSADRQLEDLLRGAGMRVSGVATKDLARLVQPLVQPPDALVIDLRDEGQLPAMLSAVKRQHPLMGVVIVAAKLEPALMLEAMRAGVNELVTDPSNPAELEAAILRVVAQKPAAKAGQVFAIIGAKGGVGCTTVAVNLATALAQLKSASILLIDLHQNHGDAAVFLGVEPRFSVVDAFENTHRLDEAFFRGLVERTKAGPDLLASSSRSVVGPVDGKRARLLIDFASRLYHYVVLDVPRGDQILLDALEAATTILLVTNQELASVRSMGRLAPMLRQRYGRGKLAPVLARYDETAEIRPEDIERSLGEPFRHVLPSDYRLALQALNRGRPVTLDNHNKLSAAFLNVARELAGMPERGAADQHHGFFSKLRGRKT